MRNVNKRGFTLIELLAVITIMGILMIVAIPAISRTIDNSRKDTFIDTAKQYASAVKTAWISDGLNCKFYNGSVNDTSHIPSAAYVGSYYVYIDTTQTSSNPYSVDLLESGGKSPWGNKDVWGFVRITVTGTEATRKTKFSVYLTDGTHTVSDYSTISNSASTFNISTSYEQLTRKQVKLGTAMTRSELSSFANSAAQSSSDSYKYINRCYVN